jgi:signal transduction histidine kinase/streptogramin lyase
MTGEDHELRFWVSDGSKLEEFDRENAAVVRTIDVPSTPRSEVMFYIDHFGVFWVMYTLTGRESGLAVLDLTENQLIRHPIYGESGKPITVGIHTAVEDAGGTLWFASNGAGLLKLDRTNWSVVRYRNHMGDAESIADDRVIALCTDSEGNVWEGLYAMEPNFFHSTNTWFNPLLREHDNPRGLGEVFINAIYKDHEKALWISTTGALVRQDPKSGQQTLYRLPGRSGDDDIIAISEDGSGNLWMGTIGAGLNRFDPKTGRYTAYTHNALDPFSISSDIVTRITVGRNGRLWLSTRDGLDSFDPQTGRAVVYRSHPGTAERFYNVTLAPDDTLWLGGFRGLYHFDPATQQFTVYSHDPKDPHSLSDNVVNSVILDQAGLVWATSGNGLNRLNPRQGNFRRYDTKDGLASNDLSCLLEDRSGMLWMSSNLGISALNPSTNNFLNYSAADGLPVVDLTGWDSCFRDEGGAMFFGGFGGGVSFHPENNLGRSESLPIVLTDFQISNASVEIGPQSPLKRAIDHTTSISLTHLQNRFSLTFAALGYWNSAAIRYRFRLEGLNEDWTEVGSDRRTVSYTTLPAGKYSFRAQAQIRPNIWTEPGIVLTVTVLPPWWATLWFRALAVSLLAMLVWILLRARIRQSNERIEARLGERLRERERIARELHDTLLQGFQMLLLRFQVTTDTLPPETQARKQLEDSLSRAEKTLQEGRDKVSTLRSEIDSGKDLASELAQFGREVSTGSQTTFLFTAEGNPRVIHPVVYEEVWMIAREAISNSFRHANATLIECVMQFSSRHFSFVCRDNGGGIPDTVLKTKSKSGHWGLVGMEERAKKIGAELHIGRGEIDGTEVKLTLRAGIAYTANTHPGILRLLRRQRQ